MKINKDLKNKLSKCVVRIIAEDININFKIPYQLMTPNKGQGTGFFIDNKGHILTCAHVIQGSKNVYIEIPSLGSDKYECVVIGMCPDFDIALLKCIKFKSKEYLDLGDSNKLNERDEVMVVGYPASLVKYKGNSNNLKFTSGIISGQQNGLIQTDSAINPGNSGGPLFSNNKVIGINSQKLVSESLDNIGYAVPINYYKIIKDNFKEKIIYRPELLFTHNNTTKDIIKSLTNGKIDNGIIISKIFENSPFLGTNIKKDTIITKINDIEIDNYGLTNNYQWINTPININILLNNFKNNETIKITFYNEDKKDTCNIKLVPIIPGIKIAYPMFEDVPYFILGGMIFMNLYQNHIIENMNNISIICILNDPEKIYKEHLILSYVFPNSKANILNNVVANDIITKVNDISISNLNDFIKALNKPIVKNKKIYIRLEEEKGKSILMLKDDLIEQDIIFSKIYRYELSNYHTKKNN